MKRNRKPSNVWRAKAEKFIGVTFGKITVLAILETNSRGKFYAKGLCSCGKEWVGLLADLRYSRGIKSCGCHRPNAKGNVRIKPTATHNEAGRGKRTAEYLAWAGMVARCYNPKYTAYSVYGGAGIRMCPRWRHSYENFLSDMGRKPSPNHSIDRINGALGYSLENCRWATKREQVLNRKSTKWITHDGETKCLKDWELHLGMRLGSLKYYTSKGLSIQDIIDLRNR